MNKKYDIVARVGERNVNGEVKPIYENVGSIMEKDGKPFIMLKRTFNPAGIPNPNNKDSAILSLFPPKDTKPAYQAKPTAPRNDFNDEIPF